MTLVELAREYAALEAVDVSDFQRRARLLQSMWHVERNFGFECVEETVTTKTGKVRVKRGALLPMPWAEETLNNYLMGSRLRCGPRFATG